MVYARLIQYDDTSTSDIDRQPNISMIMMTPLWYLSNLIRIVLQMNHHNFMMGKYSTGCLNKKYTKTSFTAPRSSNYWLYDKYVFVFDIPSIGADDKLFSRGMPWKWVCNMSNSLFYYEAQLFVDTWIWVIRLWHFQFLDLLARTFTYQ